MKLSLLHIRGFHVLILASFMLLLPGVSPADDGNVVTLSGDNWHWHPDDRVSIAGNVEATYQDFKITADSVEADLRTNIAVFGGDVKLVTKDHTVDGGRLELNLKTKDWMVDKASTRVELAVEGKSTGSAFVHSAELSGNEKDLCLHSGTLTTCELDHPHYYFSADQIDIHPDVKIVARKVSIIGLDRRLFTLNSLVIPISGFKYNLLPQVGSSAEEGMFVKTSYAYAATDTSQGFLKLDVMQKRGVGAGAEHSYKLASGSGLASIYYLADQEIGGSNITGRLQHQQNLGSVNLNLTGDYRTNSYLYYPTSTSQNWQMALSQATSASNTSLTFSGGATKGFGSNDTFNSALRHTRQFNDKLSGVLTMDMRRYMSSGMTASDSELDSMLELRQRDERYDLSLVASKRNDLDKDKYTGDQFYNSLDRLPELVFETDSYRLGQSPLFGLPFRLSMSAGRYHEMPSAVTSDRLLFQCDVLNHTLDIGSMNELSLTGGFRQAYYASDAMQNVWKLGGVLNTRYNENLKSRLTYNRQSVNGYSPFLFDYTGEYNYARFVMDYQDSQRLRWSLSTGYNLRQTQYPWQDVALRLTARPSPKYAMSISTGYDINNSRWRSLITQFRVDDPGHLGLEIGARYDLATGKLGLARGIVDYRINDLWRLESITSWNGASKKFDYKTFRLTRDLHCWEVSLTYNDETGFRNDKGFSLDFRIKAFPTTDRFGIGQYGQSVDTSMGDYYY